MSKKHSTGPRPKQLALPGIDVLEREEEHRFKTVGGYNYDEVVSALQKCIRRGIEEEAMYWALELDDRCYLALWRRLGVIACEDVGLADPEAAKLVAACSYHYLQVRDKQRRTRMPLALAILYLCRCPKNRETDHFYNHIRVKREKGWRIPVPDFALDKHTKRGRALGRGEEHFWTEATRLARMKGGSKYEFKPKGGRR